MASDAQKNQMKIALVGMRPADQVTIKGYLRVLLRLDVDLEWVGVTDFGINLFMINNEFRDASSVSKLLETNAGVPVLYIAHSDRGEGGIAGNLLTLPLKQIDLLNDWLVKNVSVLGGQQSRPASMQNSSQSAQPATQSTATTHQPVANQASSSHLISHPVHNYNLHDVIELIKTLQARSSSQSLFELSDNNQAIGIIDNARQLIWTERSQVVLSDKWRVKPFFGQTPNDQDAKDMNDWLWRMALSSNLSKYLIENGEKKYQIRYWAKPPVQMRKNALRVMAVIEAKALTVSDIAYKTGIGIDAVKNILGALLLSGNLTASIYRDLKAPPMSSSRPTNQTSAQTNQTSTQTTAQPMTQTDTIANTESKINTPPQDEKMGFLARLRRKLGL